MRVLSSLVIVVVMMLVGGSAMAQDRTPDFEAYAGLERVADDLADQWRENHEAFERVSLLRERFPQVLSQTRGRYADLRQIVNLDDELFLPMLWALASDGPQMFGMDLQAFRAWRVGLIQGIRTYGDERAAPVLLRIAAGDPHGMARERAAAAVGALGEPEWIQALVEIAEEEAWIRPQIVTGLGDARRSQTAEYLLEVATRPGEEDETVRLAVRALGDWGNQWTWRTTEYDGIRGEWEKGRLQIIEVLVGMYLDSPRVLQVEILKSLQLNGAGLSAEAARGVAEREEGARGEALRELARRLDASPLD